MTIEGDYALFAHLETVYLGCLAQRDADHAQRARGGGSRQRQGHPLLPAPTTTGSSRPATAGRHTWPARSGSRQTPRPPGGAGAESAPCRTLIAAFGGDTVAAAGAFAGLRGRDERDRPGGLRERLRAHGARGGGRRSATDSGECGSTPPSAWSIGRCGTRWKRVQPDRRDPVLVERVRDASTPPATSACGSWSPAASTPPRSAASRRSASPVDAYGVGSSLVRGENDFTADVVRVDGRDCAKAGRRIHQSRLSESSRAHAPAPAADGVADEDSLRPMLALDSLRSRY